MSGVALGAAVIGAGAGWGLNQIGSSGGGGGGGVSSSDLAPFQMQSYLAQAGLYNSQKKQLDIFNNEYEQLAPALAGILQNKMSATGLPADLARNLGQYYNQAGNKMGNYFSSRGMMNSGASQQAYQQLSQEEAAQKLSTILGQQREGINQSLSFMGQQPGVNPYGTSSLPSASLLNAASPSQPMDLSGFGALFARGLQGPSAAGVGTGVGAYGGNLANSTSGGVSGATTAFGQYTA